MTLYGGLVLIHVLAAVIGMGPSFIFPVIQSFGTTKESLQLVNKIMEKAEKVVTIGSIVLLLTGLVMGVMNPHLFTQIWYIASIILYFVAHYLAVGFAGKRTKKAAALLNNHQGDDIPNEILTLNKTIGMAGMGSALIAIVMIILMSVKPF
ncbi:DUF2269 family protein [Bacillus sp. REN16]|uniref:DUF2269 family protein n=1 Tax=Bacillus sp. REN16 TaxID=2887296 RepID=UPI001E48A393|nr:DUF2269 family protein [Bacillus sp. REN16]MCC3358759.1 DUF2269 domain-containing protein [Bacillus sp. REN16]